MRRTFLPWMPPAALIASTAMTMPLCVDLPNTASDPVIEPYSPMTISFEVVPIVLQPLSAPIK